MEEHSLQTWKTCSQVGVSSSGLGELPVLPSQSNRRSQAGPGEHGFSKVNCHLQGKPLMARGIGV